MASKLTITAVIGPADAITSLVVNNITNFSIDTVNHKVTVVSPLGIQVYDIDAATTLTDTISNKDHTIVVS